MQAEPPATTAPATTKAVPGGVQLDSAIFGSSIMKGDTVVSGWKLALDTPWQFLHNPDS